MALIRQMGVNEHVLREGFQGDYEARFIGVRRVKVNNGTPDHPKYDVDFSPKKLIGTDTRDDLFAGTPALLVLRFGYITLRARCT